MLSLHTRIYKFLVLIYVHILLFKTLDIPCPHLSVAVRRRMCMLCQGVEVSG